MKPTPGKLLSRLTDTQLRRIGFAMIASIVVFLLADITMAISDSDPPRVLEDLVLGFTFGTVLALSIRAEPRNGAVWTMMWAGFIGALGQFTGHFGEALTDFSTAAIEAGEVAVSPSSLNPVAALAFAVGLSVWVPGIFLLAIHLLILFPDGRARSTWWRRVGWTTGIIMGIMVIAGFVNTAPWVDKPYDEIFADELSTGLVIGLGMIPLMLAALAAAIHLIRRYRASSGEKRLQYRWVTWALAIFVLNIFSFGVVPEPVAELSSTLTLANIGVAVGIAITRYGLYNIDIVVSRSITYGALAAFIGGVYIALVVGIGTVLGRDSSFVLSIVATVLVAIAFEPARRWVERWANRLVYGERATPYEVLARFSRRSSELSDEELVARAPHLIVDGAGATSATLWIRTDSGFRSAATWPEGSPVQDLEDIDFHDPNADYSLPVFHDGELLGGLSLSKSGGENVTPAEESLLRDLAAGMGLALRNAGLTGQLRQQIADLEESRERILAAADAARRALERDLDSGPQQQLVAVKVKLGPTRKRAEQLGAEKSATLLAQIEDDAGEAIQAVRDFAGGIYPPLLEAEGLAVAIAQQAHKAAIPVSVHSNGVARYQRETEAAVYFAVMEALQNAAKYSEAESVAVNLTAGDGRLRFEVRDDGRGFEPASVANGAGLTGMSDRLDTVGGEFRIGSSPGEGTVVKGSVPVGELVPT